MDEDLRWIVGIAASFALAIVTSAIAAFRNLAARIATNNKDIHQRIDDVKEKYVRRDDLDSHLTRLDHSVREVRDEMREFHRQVLDAVTRDR